MSQETEITRFSSEGKTFFFNRNETRNGSYYLAVNALYGEGNRERLVVFENQMLPFRRHSDIAIGEILGADLTEDEDRCPDCGSRKPAWEPRIDLDDTGWALVCTACGSFEEPESLTVVQESEPGMFEKIKEEENDG